MTVWIRDCQSKDKGGLVNPPQRGALTKSTSLSPTLLPQKKGNSIHPHSRVILKLTITLKMTKAFREFTEILMNLITNAQMDDPRFKKKEEIHYPNLKSISLW
jgi:hypothetical protein